MGGIHSIMSSSRKRLIGIELIVGSFMFLILCALGFVTIILSYDNVFTKSYEMTVLFQDVTGLIRGDKVYVQGVDVGRVKDMLITKDGVEVDLTLKYEVRLREDYSIRVEPSSVLGGRFVAIKEGSDDAPLLPSEATIVGDPPIDIIAEASAAIKEIRSALEEGGILGNLEATMANVRELSDKLKNGEGTLGKLLTDDTLYEDVEKMASNLRSISDRLEKGEGSLGKLMNDDEVYDNIAAISADLKEVSGRLARGEGTIGKLFAPDDTLYKDLSEAVASMNKVMGSISSGEGTLGKLVNDDELYEELKNALVEVRAMLDDLRETSPFTSLTSIFFGAF